MCMIVRKQKQDSGVITITTLLVQAK